ncbi:MAG: hypothetical protein R3E50_01655 [Halioglobus sp.]
MLPRILKLVSSAVVLTLLQACSHPIDIVGQGDVISASGTRNCLLEDHAAALDKCTKNYVVWAYQEPYSATPRPGWFFDHWGKLLSQCRKQPVQFQSDCGHGFQLLG